MKECGKIESHQKRKGELTDLEDIFVMERIVESDEFKKR